MTMEFNHRNDGASETIAAIATPPGEGGVAIVRISGPRALDIADLVFSGPVHTYSTHTAHYGRIIDRSGKTVDQVLLLVMQGPRSYTGENTVEVHCHGGSLISRRVLEVILQAGARAAAPGEFSLRSFLNGKMDLAQAEAVQELIGAKNDLALSAAEQHLQGKLSKQILQFQKSLTEVAAVLEAWVDFPEEGLEFATMEELCETLNGIKEQMTQLIHSFHDGKILSEGVALCLVGSPNVGKSSLMNALLDKERAIVTHVAGTTRDLLEDNFRLNGLNLRLIDTAGIRETSELVEQEGIRRSKEAMQQADLVLLLLDVTNPVLNATESEMLAQLSESNGLVIWNKCDLSHEPPPALNFPNVVEISAKEGQGIAQLHEAIDRLIWKDGPPSQEETIITNIRHKEALVHAVEGCDRVIEGLQQDVSPEFLTLDMRHALNELGIIIGTNITEDILSSIFSKFCIGK